MMTFWLVYILCFIVTLFRESFYDVTKQLVNKTNEQDDNFNDFKVFFLKMFQTGD